MKVPVRILAALTLAATLPSTALATNGDNLIGVGPKSRAMGGVGIAAPQDAISAVFANPAAMCVTPGCNAPEANFAGTLFMPQSSASLSVEGFGNYSADAKRNVYAIPAIGLSMPIDPVTRRWRFGLSAYGVTGLGVDYRNTELDGVFDLGGGMVVPRVQGEYTSLQIMKFAPSISYQALPNLSVGVALHVDYASLDLRNGSAPSYGVGAQVGLLYQPTEHLSLGAVYISAQSTDFDNVMSTPAGSDNLELESPQQVGVGVGYTFLDDRLLAEVNGKWLNWSDAAGYSDFDWTDQWVAAFGLQYEAIREKLFLRAGYNYGNNPVRENNGWGAGTRTVQGVAFPEYYYETFRVIGFPAVVEHHVTAGLGYAFSKQLEISISYMYAFENTVSESGSLFGMAPVEVESVLAEHAADFALTWRF